MIGTRWRAAVELAGAQLRHYRVRAMLAVLGVAVAVLAAVVLVSLGYSVHTVGEAGVNRIGADLWATAGPTTFAPGAAGGIDNRLTGAHTVASEVDSQEDVADARAIAFQTVYVGTEPGEYETIIGAGTTGDGAAFETTAGESFSSGDTHFANGSYDGPMSGEALVDRQAAEKLGVGVGDTIHVGGTVVAADEHTFEVVGISNDVRRYMGAPTVMLHLSELQTVTGTTRNDPASTVVIRTTDEGDTETVREEVDATYPDLTVRTNREQLKAVLSQRSLVLAAGVSLIVLAVVTGLALVANVFGLLVYQQRRQLAALKASGVRSGTLVKTVFAEGLAVGALGALLGLSAVTPAVTGLNVAVEYVVGFEDIISAPWWAFPAGFGVAVGVGVLGSVVAGIRVGRVSPLEHLER